MEKVIKGQIWKRAHNNIQLMVLDTDGEHALIVEAKNQDVMPPWIIPNKTLIEGFVLA